MSLFQTLRQRLSSHTARKRATTYFIAALLVALTVAVPTGTRTAYAAGLSNGSMCPTQLELTPTAAPPQKPVYVCGSGFVASGSRVELHFYNPSKNRYQFLQYATPTNGEIKAKITVPIDPGEQYEVVAYQRSSGIREQAPFTIIGGFESLNPVRGSNVAPSDPLCIQLGGSPAPGQPLSLQVWGLPASSWYNVEWQNKNNNLNNTEVAKGNTTASGTFSTSFDVPANPSGFYDLIVLTLAGDRPTATYYSYNTSCFSINEPGDGTISWSWDGVGWDANSTVTFTFDGSQLEQGTTDTKGSFGIWSFTSSCPPPGTYSWTITGTANGQPQNWSNSFPVGSGC